MVEQHTTLANQVRSLVAEQWIETPVRIHILQQRQPNIIDDVGYLISPVLRQLLFSRYLKEGSFFHLEVISSFNVIWLLETQLEIFQRRNDITPLGLSHPSPLLYYVKNEYQDNIHIIYHKDKFNVLCSGSLVCYMMYSVYRVRCLMKMFSVDYTLSIIQRKIKGCVKLWQVSPI